jgi:hypothetical protein
MMVAAFGVFFLTPLNALFGLAAAVPLAALLARERRASQIRRVLAVPDPRRRMLAPPVIALILLSALVGIAAAQPVIVRQQLVDERADAQAFFVFDTSLSMEASAGPDKPTRLARAKRLSLRLQATLPDVPIGVASMTNRVLPHLMPTTDAALFAHTVTQSIQIDQPPPSQVYPGRATTFLALVPLTQSHFFSAGVPRRLVVVFTDGEAQPASPLLLSGIRGRMSLIFVHVWAASDRIYDRKGGRLPDPKYQPDPTSGQALDQLTTITGGRAYSEKQLGQITRASREAVGYARAEAHIDAYARVALAPWVVLVGVLPLGFLLWKRNL